jgi:hypothetical protein
VRVPWRAALGLALSAALMYWVLRGTSWSAISSALRTSDVRLWALSIFVSQLIFPLRARRWKPILAPVATNLEFGPLWRSTAIGMMVTTFAGRAGELARAYALTREEPRIPFTAGLASLVVDRTFDAIILLLLLFAAMLDPHLAAGMRAQGISVGAIVAFPVVAIPALITVLYLALFAPARIESVIGAILRVTVPRWEPGALRLARRFIDGLAVLRNPKLLASVFLWTLAHWVTNAVGVWLSFRALGVNVPVTAALLTQGLIAMGAAAVPTPGFVGAFEKAGQFALGLYAVDKSVAAAWAITFHVLTLIPITIIGLWYVSRLGFSFSELRGAPERSNPA